MLTVFDIGMYDGADTAYYLEQGFRVVAVEANPGLVERAEKRFATEIASDRLRCVQAAITADGSEIDLVITGDDLGSSTVVGERATGRWPLGKIRVPGITMADLLAKHGVPHLLKVDIEGADAMCIRALSREQRPKYLSFEAGDDVLSLIEHVQGLGYNQFKIINQVSFLELANQRSFVERASRRLMRTLGYANPRRVRRSGRFFNSGHSSGPAPWESDGNWRSASDVKRAWTSAKNSGQLTAWYDIHATSS